MPELGLAADGAPLADLAALFPVAVRGVRLEIGIGGGEHLVHEAIAHPDIGFIGVEPFEQGFAKAVAALAAAGCRNVRLVAGDAVLLLARVPAQSLLRVDLLYPDPWPKRRHWKRRFVSDANLDAIARTLTPAGEFRVASDIAAYIDWTLLKVTPRADLVWTACRADDWRKPWPDWPGTRYEVKALRAGRVPGYLVFARTDAPRHAVSERPSAP